VAAVVVEPVLGEGGYIVPPADFLAAPAGALRSARHPARVRRGADGHGPHGQDVRGRALGRRADILLLAKGIASGMPLGAMMAPRERMTWPQGSHGSTIAGNPVAIAAGLATIDLLEGGLCDNSARVGDGLQAMLKAALDGNQRVTEVRGVGLMIGVELATPELAEAVSNLCFERGLLVLECGKKAIRLSPPLIINEEQARATANVFAGACAKLRLTGRERPGRSGQAAVSARLLHLERAEERRPLEIVDGQGARFVTADGARWWDLGSMTWNASLGHGHPRMREALARRRPRACSRTRRRCSPTRCGRASCSPR
jgi:4-aminobutyrate aminotransferase-like enzyme